MDAIKWAFGLHAPTSVQSAAFVLTFVLAVVALAITGTMFAYGFGIVALALWIGLPLWFIIKEYKRREK